LDTDIDLAIETSMVGIGSSSGGYFPGGGRTVRVALLFLTGDTPVRIESKGERIGEEAVVDLLLPDSDRSSLVLMVNSFVAGCPGP
jgi:hypothetical protein